MMDRMSVNATDFADQLAQLGEAIQEDVFQKVIKKVLIDLWTRIQETTPVDTGRARASWMLDAEWTDWQLPPGDYKQAVADNVLKVIGSLPKSEQYVLFNNVDYISYLEDGSSVQAPGGFISVALAALANNVQAAVQSVWWGSPL